MDTVIATLGDISVTRSEVITPAGTAALAGSNWSVVDRTRTSSFPTSWVIVGIILLCPIGLLLLFVPRNERTRGHVDITVTNADISHQTVILVASDAVWDRIVENLNRAGQQTAAVTP